MSNDGFVMLCIFGFLLSAWLLLLTGIAIVR